jgi:hypothetical protein
VINAVRFATAFFGKGQFVPGSAEQRGDSWHLTQALSAPYYQPLDPPQKVSADDWRSVRGKREQTEVCRMTQSATVTETDKGFRLRLQASGTKDVPLAVEINFREGGKLEGVESAHKVDEGWILPTGIGVYRMGSDRIRFGPGLRSHLYTQVRGAEPKLSGPSVYLTGFTPFDHTLEFECLPG